MKKLLLCSFLLIGTISFVQAQLPADSLKQFVGTYKFPEGTVVPQVVVALEGGGLTITSSAGVSELKHVVSDTFIVVSFEGVAVFKRDASRKIIGITIDARGYLLEGTKTDVSAFVQRRRLVAVAR